jgi:hypothetical protein
MNTTAGAMATTTDTAASDASEQGWMHFSERAAAIIALAFAGVSMFYANTVSHLSTLTTSDHRRMAISAAAALGMVTMVVVSLAIGRRSRQPIVVVDEPSGERRISISAAGLVVVAAIVTIFQIALWTWT